ncbi:MAG: ATP-binding cassette domain-containing protein [Acetobacteraceae bacterium]
MGPSGCGKTTILNLIGGLDRLDSGEVVVAHTHLEMQSSRQLARWRAHHIGVVFQSHNRLGILSATR